MFVTFQIAGFDSTLPAVLGRSRCIRCSFDGRTAALHEAVAHIPDYIVTNCLDIMDTDVLKLIMNIHKQGKVLDRNFRFCLGNCVSQVGRQLNLYLSDTPNF